MNNEIKVTIILAEWNPELGVFVAHLVPSGGAIKTEELIGIKIVIGELPDFTQNEQIHSTN